MGRGRAKAKQTKVARQLKYSTTGTDLDRLRAELSGDHDLGTQQPDPVADEVDDEDDPYAEYAAYADDDEDEDAEDRVG